MNGLLRRRSSVLVLERWRWWAGTELQRSSTLWKTRNFHHGYCCGGGGVQLWTRTDPCRFYSSTSILPANENQMPAIAKELDDQVNDDDDDGDEHLPFRDDDNDDDGGEPTSTITKLSSAFSPDNNKPALQQLAEYYRDEYGIAQSLTKHMESMPLPANFAVGRPHVMWSMRFHCPVHDTVYHAGILRTEQEQAILQDGLVYYSTKALAKKAVAGRVLDSLQLQIMGQNEPRWCEEEPLLDLLAQQHESDKEYIAMAENEFVGPAEGSSNEGDINETGILDTNSEDVVSPEAENATSRKKDDEEEYLVMPMPSAVGKSPAVLALERLSSSVTASLALRSHDAVNQNADTRSTCILRNAARFCQGLTSMRKDENPNRVYVRRQQPDAQHVFVTGKSLLEALAAANQYTHASRDDNAAIYTAALDIINMLWRLNDNNHHPDADCYTCLIQCINARSPTAARRQALNIVMAMEKRQEYAGHVPPPPNTGTYNALIQCFAQRGGIKGRFRFESAANFVPNRESFLCLLSSCCHRVAPESVTPAVQSFDLDFARTCITRMKELSLSKDDPNLWPDTAVYNAPLRWSGGAYCQQARPYARFIPWDLYSTLYANGAQTTDAAAGVIAEAQAMEVWVNEMQAEPGVAPNLETYEALIQAWVRTATIEGVEKADELGNFVLSGALSEPLRLQTFHPILAAFMLLNSADGLDRAAQWIDRLDTISQQHSQLAPDHRVLTAFIAACRDHQLSMASLPDKSSSEHAAKMRSLAERCSEVLNKLNGSDNAAKFVDAMAFTFTIEAWETCALSYAKHGDMEGANDALAHMLECVAAYETVVVETIEPELSLLSNKVALELSLQAKHLLIGSSNVYGMLVQSISRLIEESINDPRRANDLVNAMVPKIERIGRHFFENEAIYSRYNTTSTRDGGPREPSLPVLWTLYLTHPDRFSYSWKPKHGSVRKPFFVWETANLIRNIQPSTTTHGDLARLWKLIARKRDVTEESAPRADALIDEAGARITPNLTPHRIALGHGTQKAAASRSSAPTGSDRSKRAEDVGSTRRPRRRQKKLVH